MVIVQQNDLVGKGDQKIRNEYARCRLIISFGWLI